MKSYLCVICGFIYSEENGWPKEGIVAGTKWEDVPLNWNARIVVQVKTTLR